MPHKQNCLVQKVPEMVTVLSGKAVGGCRDVEVRKKSMYMSTINSHLTPNILRIGPEPPWTPGIPGICSPM